MLQWLADKRRELILTLAPSSAAACSLVPGWVSPLPFSRYLKTTLYYLLFCRVNVHISAYEPIIELVQLVFGFAGKCKKTLINGEVIKLNQKSVIRVICCYISSSDSQHILSSFNIKILKSLVLVTFSLPLANPYSTCTKEEAEQYASAVEVKTSSRKAEMNNNQRVIYKILKVEAPFPRFPGTMYKAGTSIQRMG